jgi:hypothetical protein
MKLLVILGLAFTLAGVAFADIIGTINTTDGHHYELGKIGSIWELREADGFMLAVSGLAISRCTWKAQVAAKRQELAPVTSLVGELLIRTDEKNGNVVGHIYDPHTVHEGTQIDDPLPVQNYSAPNTGFDSCNSMRGLQPPFAR